MTSREFSPNSLKEVQSLFEDFPNKKSSLLMVLRVAEEEFGCIDDAAIQLVARTCEVSASHVLGMVTFYTHFKRPYHGKNRLMVCATLMCAMGGTKQVTDVTFDLLGIHPGECTHDGLFSLEHVECLADCDKPVVIQIDKNHTNQVNAEKMKAHIESLLKKEGKTSGDYKGKDVRKMDPQVPFIPAKRSI